MVKRGIRRVGQVAPVKTGDAVVDRALQEMAGKLNPALRSPFAQAVVLEATLGEGLNKLGHGMGVPVHHFTHAAVHEPAAVITNAQSENRFPERQVWVRLSGTTDVDVVLFLFPALG